MIDIPLRARLFVHGYPEGPGYIRQQSLASATDLRQIHRKF